MTDDTGPARLVRVGNLVGVASEREEQAVRAAKQIKIEWDERTFLPHSKDIYEAMRAQETNDQLIEEKGDINAAFGKVKQELNSTYYQPFHAHASIAPACAVADVRADQVIVWCASPGPHPLKGALAQLLGVPAAQVHINYLESAGGYGQNGADDVTAEAVILSRELGKPVRLQWSREDEFVWEPKSAPMAMAVHGGIDSDGNIIAWDYNVWSPTHAARPRVAQQLLVFQFMNATLPPPARLYIGGERNAPTNYAFPNSRVTIHWVPNPYLRVSSFRSLGGMGNTFANESFIDELAFAAKMDPLEFRLRHLEDNRARELLLALADKVNWKPRPLSGMKRDGMAEGRGLAFAQYENDEALVACVADVIVDTASGTVTVKRVTIAHDCGLIINPDGLRNQIEGNVIQSLSRALKEQVTFDDSHITSLDWQTYPILTFSEIPDIDILLINRPNEPALGAGEPATITTAPAVANAIFDATGARLYQMPFTPGRVKQALRTEF
jgi:CO/xanthine dehydrogenase Mo-binding subunit